MALKMSWMLNKVTYVVSERNDTDNRFKVTEKEITIILYKTHLSY